MFRKDAKQTSLTLDELRPVVCAVSIQRPGSGAIIGFNNPKLVREDAEGR